MNSPESQALAADILNHAKSKLLVPLRFLDVVFCRFADRIVYDSADMGIDGRHLYCNPDDLLRAFAEDPRQPARIYLHMILHGVFHHLSHPKAHDPLWQLACDMAVEHTILGLALPAVASGRDDTQRATLAAFEKDVDPLTADRLYRHFLAHPPRDREQLMRLFKRDSHLRWLGQKDKLQESGDVSEEDGLVMSDAFDIIDEHGRQSDIDWDVLTSEVEIALENMQESIGNAAAAMKQQLQALRNDTISYDEFLRRFAAPHEAIQLNPDAFDPIFYTYGLRTYGNLPLIEPQETQEVEKIDEFVIAIDTSGSCSGDVVQAFLEKTVSILRTSDRFQHQVNVRILQCDSAIQHETHLTDLDGIADYLAVESLHGFGGTDFRPVFDRVDELIEQGAFRNLRGLLYFTDGLGVYPKKVPAYDTGFVFLDRNPHLDDPDFPPWAMKVVLSSDTIDVR